MTLTMSVPPRELVTNGRHNFGVYNNAIQDLNVLDAGPKLTRPVRNARLKEWEAFQLSNDQWFVCGAVYDTKLLGLIQVIAVERASGTIHRFLRHVPTWQLAVARGLSGTTTSGSAQEYSMTIRNEMADGTIDILASQPATSEREALSLTAHGICSRETAAHFVACLPFSDKRALYSHKCAMDVEATMTIGNQTVEFERHNSFLILDDHKGQYPSPMKYDWVTGGVVREGVRTVVNFTDNQCRSPEINNENFLMVDSAVHRFGAITIDRPAGVDEPWHITDAHGHVDMVFAPLVQSEIHVGPKRVLAEYYGPYGEMSGHVVVDGERHDLDGLHAMGEKKAVLL